MEGRKRALGDKALFSYLIVTLQEKRREKEKRREEEERRGVERRGKGCSLPPLESGSQRGRFYNLLSSL